MLERQVTRRLDGGGESCLVPVAVTESSFSLVRRDGPLVFLDGLQPRALAARWGSTLLCAVIGLGVMRQSRLRSTLAAISGAV